MSEWLSTGPARRYGLALALLGLALGARLALEPWLQGGFPFVTVLAAVGWAAWRLGPGPAAMTAVLGFAAVNSGLVTPAPVRSWSGGPPAWTLAGYLLSSAVLVAFGVTLALQRRRSEADHEARRVSQQALQRSESLLRGLYESTRLCMGVVELTDDGDVLHLQDNAGSCRVFGVPPGGTANRHASALGASADTIALWHRHYLASQADQRPVDFAYAQATPDGVRWYEVTVAPLPLLPGERPRFSYILEDATDRHGAEQRLREAATQARLALDVAEIGTWRWEPDLDVLHADRRCRELCGLQELGRLCWQDFIAHVHEDDRAAFEQDVAEARHPRGSGTYSRELRIVRPDGSVRWAVSRGQMLVLREDEATGRRALLLNTLLDVTSRKQAEASMAESDRRKNEFIATLSHELRNPLAPLRTGVEMLRRAGADPALRERVIATMNRQLGHMVRMIDDLLDVSRITRDQLELRRQPVALSQVITAAVETAQSLVEAREHTLTLHLPGPVVTVHGDVARLTQVLTNLLHNAAKYTPSGGHIDVTLEADDSAARVSVADNGIGIPAELLPRVFDLFAQVDRHASASHDGLGIGLAISRRLVEMHGGTLEATSEGAGQGCRFTMTLPRLVAPAGPATRPGQPLPEATSAARRILIVDDNVDAARSMCELLNLHGHQARAVHDGAAALQLAAQWTPEVALLDIGMPQMDGHELARRLVAQAGAQAPLMLAVTGWGQRADRERSAAAGFDDHLVKPVDPVALLRLIDSLPLHLHTAP